MPTNCGRARGYGISCSFAHASHCRQAASNCALASSSVAAWPSVRISAGLPRMPVQRPEPAHALRPAALLIDAPHGPIAHCRW